MLWPITSEVIAALWFERVLRGSWVSFAVSDNRRGIDQTCILESWEPVVMCDSDFAMQVTDWRWAAGVDTVRPVQT